MPLLPWDCWGLILGEDEDLSEEDLALLDQAALLSLPENYSLTDIRLMYQTNEKLRVPPIISSLIGDKFEKVDLTEDCASLFKTQ